MLELIIHQSAYIIAFMLFTLGVIYIFHFHMYQFVISYQSLSTIIPKFLLFVFKFQLIVKFQSFITSVS